MTTMKSKLATLWIFATLNYLYCDVVTLMNPELLKQFLAGRVGGMEITPVFLLASAVLVEIPISMVLLSRVLSDRTCRLANVAAGLVMTAAQLGSVLVQTPPAYYIFFSVVEIGSTLAIVLQSWRWTVDAGSSPRSDAEQGPRVARARPSAAVATSRPT